MTEKDFYQQSLDNGLISVDPQGVLRRDMLATIKGLGKEKFKKLLKKVKHKGENQ